MKLKILNLQDLDPEMILPPLWEGYFKYLVKWLLVMVLNCII